MRCPLAALILCFASLAAAGDPFVAPEHEDLMFYHVFLDRFANGDPSNDDGNPRSSPNPSSGFGWHGGDIAGVREKLPYIAGLGVNAIWLSPFVENVSDYHGYAAFDWYNVDPNFGTIEELRALIDEANAAGIAVYFDMVAGHMGGLVDSAEPGYPGYRPPPQTYALRWRTGLQYPPPFDSLDLFHAHGHIGNFSAPEQELGELSGLDDLKTETPFIRSQMRDVWEFWMEETGVSGFRIDTVKHVDLGFWETFLPALQAKADELGRANYFTFGEIFGADDSFMRVYVGELNGAPYKLDAALDFQYYYASQGVFARADQPPTDWTGRIAARAAAQPGHHLRTPNFFDNHDVPRFLNVARNVPGGGLAERVRRLELALIAIFTAPGPPIVYYGTEQRFDGGHDPQNREDMFDGAFESGPSSGDNFDTESPQYRLVAQLARLRREVAPLRRGSFDAHFAESNGPGVMAFSRAFGGQRVLVVINTDTQTRTLPSLHIPGLEDMTLADAFEPSNTIVFDDGGSAPAREIPPQGASIFLDPELIPPPPATVLAQSPADGESGVPTSLQEIEIRFSQPMNRTLTESSFDVVPQLVLTPSWSDGDTVLTMTVGETLAESTLHTVTIGTGAETASGAPLAVASVATWVTDRAPRPLPPLPAPLVVARRDTGFAIDGSDADWGIPGALPADTANVPGGDLFVWSDSAGDDDGPGTYTYPTNAVFSGAEADLATFAFAWTATDLQFLIRPAAVNPSASFFTPYFGIAIDTGEGGRRELGHDAQTGANGVADALLRPDAAANFEIVFAGPNGMTVVDAAGDVVFAGSGAFSSSTGVVEISVPRSALDLENIADGHRLNFVVYTGLEVFGSMREVSAATGNFEPGGGIAAESDPDIFDLAADPLSQRTDLEDYDAIYPPVIGASYLSVLLGDPPATDLWILH